MRLLRQIFGSLRLRRRMRPAGYSAEVLFAGWVDLPSEFRERLEAAACESSTADLHLAFYSSSSIERGKVFFNRRESARSARILPPVWQRAQ